MTRTRVARKRFAKGVYADKYGYSITWQEYGRQVEKRFALDTPIDQLKKYRALQLARTSTQTKHQNVGSFTRDAVRFLRTRRGKPSFPSDRSHLRVWVHRFGHLSRFAISREMVREALLTWQIAGYSAQELKHRFRLLRQCYATIDQDGPNPCLGIKPPTVPKLRPRSVPESVVRDVALNLRKSEILGRLHDGQTRARYLVLATTGQRPAQMLRAVPADVDLERRLWIVDPAKGDAGAVVYLNDDMYAAWALFIAERAWGKYNRRSFVRTLQRNGWPKGVRPYNMRHRIGLTLSELGVDLGDIQMHMGHTSPATTRQFYVPGVPARMQAASLKLDGRMPEGAAARFHKPASIDAPSHTTTPRNNVNNSVDPRAALPPQARRRKSTKPA